MMQNGSSEEMGLGTAMKLSQPGRPYPSMQAII